MSENLSEESTPKGKTRQKGQFIIEYILLAVLVIGVYTIIKRQVGGEGLVAQLFSGPWQSIAKMMEDGSWDVSRGEDEVHPLTTVQSREGDTE